jgi:hypothetical protein
MVGPSYHRKAQPSFASEAQKHQDKCLRELQKLQREAKREISALNEVRRCHRCRLQGSRV